MENQTNNQAAQGQTQANSAPQNKNQSNQNKQPAQNQQASGAGQAQKPAPVPSDPTAVPASSASAAPSMTTVLEDSAVPPVVCEWLSCLRRPALSMQYSVQKRHVPDLDNDTGAQAQAGVDTDEMKLQGGFTIRYFDLAAGALALATAGCLIKLCCAMKRKMF